MRRIVTMALLLGACGDVADAVNAGDATRIELDIQVPALVRFPPHALPASPIAGEVELEVPVPMDLLAILREQERTEEARLVEEQRDRLEAIELREVEYEVGDPNLLPADLAPVVVDLAPLGVTSPADPRVEPLGATVAVDAGRAIATRELDYAEGGREAATPYLEALSFQLLARTSVSVPAGAPIPAEAMLLRLNFKVRVRLRLTGS